VSPAFSSLRIRNYRLFASGQLISLTGTWMQRTAQDWLVLDLAHDKGTALGITTALQFLPMLLFGLYGGVLADRYPKRRLLIIAQVAMGLQALLLGVLTVAGVVELWHVYALALALGLASVIDTPTRQAFAVELVGKDDLPNAVSLNSATFNSGRVLGPAAAGLLINAIGTGPVFLVNAASYVAVLAGLLMIRTAELQVSKRVARAPGQLRAGLTYVRRRPELLWPIVLVAVIGTFGLNFQITTALVAKLVFHRGAGAYGLLGTAFAFGSLIGALLAARRGIPRQRLLLGAALAFGLLEIVVGLMPTYTSFLLLLIPTGFAVLTFTTAANASVQLASSAAMRGRVMALYVLVFLGGTPIGAPVIGWLAETYGARWSLIGGGLVSAVATLLVGWALLRARQLRVVTRLHSRPHFYVEPVPEAPELDEARSA
jgi:MFS family permease